MKIRFEKGEKLSDLILRAEIPMLFPEGINRSDLSEKIILEGECRLSFQTYNRWMSFNGVGSAHETKRLATLEHFLKAYALGMINDEVVIPTRTCAGKWNLYAQYCVKKCAQSCVRELCFEVNPYRQFAPGTKFLLVDPCT